MPLEFSRSLSNLRLIFYQCTGSSIIFFASRFVASRSSPSFSLRSSCFFVFFLCLASSLIGFRCIAMELEWGRLENERPCTVPLVATDATFNAIGCVFLKKTSMPVVGLFLRRRQRTPLFRQHQPRRPRQKKHEPPFSRPARSN